MNKNYTKYLPYSTLSIATLTMLLLLSEVAWGSGTGQDLGTVAANISRSLGNVAKLITSVSYVAGVAFALMGMMKFKAHKDQPQQVPLSQPLVLIAIAAGLVFLPSLIDTTGQTVWNGNQVIATTDEEMNNF